MVMTYEEFTQLYWDTDYLPPVAVQFRSRIENVLAAVKEQQALDEAAGDEVTAFAMGEVVVMLEAALGIK